MARILWFGDAGCHTGFAQVTHAIGDRLVLNHGHDVHVLATNFDGDAGHWPTPMKLYRANKNDARDVYGQGRFIEMIGEVMPDVCVMLYDPFVVMKFLFRNERDQGLITARARPLLAYMPIDGINQPTTWQNVPKAFEHLDPIDEHSPQPSFHPIAMSRFGQEQLPPGSPLIYHGVDTELFRPASEKNPLMTSTGIPVKNKKDAKLAINVDPDSFLVLRVDRNSVRKNYADTWKALQPVMERHTEIVTWFHCKPQGDGLEMPELFSRNEKTAKRFLTPGRLTTFRGWEPQDMAVLYNAADLFVSTSWGEGFGLTLGEAAACEVPIVAQNVSSIPEVVGPGGVLIEPERLITVFAGHDQWLPNVDAFSDAIEKLYSSRGARRDLGQKGRQHVLDNFSWDHAAAQFDELITGLTHRPSGGSPGGD